MTKSIEIDGETITVDKELVPLIMALNNVGLKTEFSCWGHDKDEKAYVIINLENVEVTMNKLSSNVYNGEKKVKLGIYWDKNKIEGKNKIGEQNNS